MIKRHHSILHNHLTELVNCTDLSQLIPRLVFNNVFTDEMVNRILSEPSAKLQATNLYLNVPKRGPLAFSGLIKSLQESGHNLIAQKLVSADAMLQENGPPQQLTFSQSQATSSYHDAEDSPDSSPTHRCLIPMSANPVQLPEYSRTHLNNIFQNTHISRDDRINIGEACENLPVQVKYAQNLNYWSNRLPETYRMTSNPRGFALVINNISFDDPVGYQYRNGAENDGIAMKELLEQLYFKVEPHSNQTRREMQQLVHSFATKPEWREVDCCFVVIMSHGKEGDSEEDTEIVGKDGFGYKIRDILSSFNHNNAPYLHNKPKIFIFQSCRGVLSDNGVKIDKFNLSHLIIRRDTEHDGRPEPKVIVDRSRSDMFVAHPVPPGYKANRDKYTGTWFIQNIVKVFCEFAYQCDLEDLFKIVDSRIKEMINLKDPNFQTVTTRSIGWSKKLYFNPGLHFANEELIRAVPYDPGMDVVDTPSDSQSNGKRKEDLMQLTPNDADEKSSGCFRGCRPS